MTQHWSSVRAVLSSPQADDLRRRNKEETVTSIHWCMSIHQTVQCILKAACCCQFLREDTNALKTPMKVFDMELFPTEKQ